MNRTAVITAVLALAAAGCSGGVQRLSFPNPPPTVGTGHSSGPTLPSDLSAINQPAVPGATTTTAPSIGPGPSAVNGTVFGPNGPVPGATVQVDRFVGDGTASTQTTTAADGTWSVANILGGRYRVRAWQSPTLAMTAPQFVFLGSNATVSVQLTVTGFPGPVVSIAMNPLAPQLRQMDNLVVQVTNPTVGVDGVLRYPPDVGAQVTLTNGPDWQVYNGNPLSTGADGTVLFQVSCQTAGADPLSAAIGSGAPAVLPVPHCFKPPPPTTTTVSPPTTCPNPTTSIPFGTTTTTSLAFGNC